MFDPLAALMRFLNARPEREAELMRSSADSLERARRADRRFASAMAALQKIVSLDCDSATEELEAIRQIAEDELADITQATTAVILAGEMLVTAAHGASMSAGWWQDLKTGESLLDAPRVVPEKLMLIVSEVGEAMEGHRKGLPDDKLPHRRMIEVELADAVIRIADLAGAMRLDLGGAIAEKMAFNAVRPDHKPEARLALGGKAY